MPNVWTHMIYGEWLWEKVRLPDWTTLDSRALPLFRFGCQGPDPLFYHRFYPWMSAQSAVSTRLGGLMHRYRCGPFLRTMLRACEGAPIHDLKVVYTLGWLMHHTLDRIAHPFVFARQGPRKRDHQRLETALDTIVAERLRGIDTKRTPVRNTLDAGTKLPDAVASLTVRAIAETYPEQAAGAATTIWQQSYRDMLAAMRLFHDPYGVKRLLTGGAIEPYVPGRRSDPSDAANERRELWTHPAASDLVSEESFWDVWERAVADGERVLGAAVEWLNAAAAQEPGPQQPAAAWEAFVEALGDLSYETGLAADREP